MPTRAVAWLPRPARPVRTPDRFLDTRCAPGLAHGVRNRYSDTGSQWQSLWLRLRTPHDILPSMRPLGPLPPLRAEDVVPHLVIATARDVLLQGFAERREDRKLHRTPGALTASAATTS